MQNKPTSPEAPASAVGGQAGAPAVSLFGEDPSVTRIPLHTRQVFYRGFARSDGLWDVEGTLLDTKEVVRERTGMPTLPPGSAVHHMGVRATVDDALVVVAIATRTRTLPFDECLQAMDPVQRLVGHALGHGWRKAIDTAIGGVGGCTHMRELLYNLATAGIQAIPGYRDQQRRRAGLAPPASAATPPHYVGQCMSWRLDGPVVQRIYPQFHIPSLPPEKTPP